jgi:DNA-binding transcriptional regulator YhcF (GntR family)
MTSSVNEILASLHLRRETPIPPFLQIKSQFEYLIVTGQLEPGRKLPSIREVAKSLGVGPATVVRAYRELEIASLTVSNKGVGFFVVGAGSAGTQPHARVRQQARDLLASATADGIGIDQVLQIFLAEVAELRPARDRPQLIVLSKRAGRVDELAMHLRHALADAGAEVIGLALEDVAADLDGYLPRLTKAGCVACLLFDLKQAKSLLSPAGIEVIPLLATLRDDTRERIIHLPAGTKVAVVSAGSAFLDGMITAISSLNPNVTVIGSCEVAATRELRLLARKANCVVHGTLARDRVHEVLPRSTTAIELVYIPDDTSIAALRKLLLTEARR